MAGTLCTPSSPAVIGIVNYPPPLRTIVTCLPATERIRALTFFPVLLENSRKASAELESSADPIWFDFEC